MGSKSSTIDRLSSAFNFFFSSALQILTFPSACRTMETVVFVPSPFFFFSNFNCYGNLQQKGELEFSLCG